AIVITGAREANHLPRAHVAVAAIDRGGKEALLRVLQELLEELLGIRPFEADLPILEVMQDCILELRGELGEGLAGVTAGCLVLTVTVEGCERGTIHLGGGLV